MSKIKKLYLDISMLSVFRALLDKPLIKKFVEFSSAKSEEEKINSYAEMVSEIYRDGGSLTEAVRRLIFEDENVYVKTRALGKKVSESVLFAASHELAVLSDFASLTKDDFKEELSLEYLSPFSSEKCDFVAEYENRLNIIQLCGYGIFASYPMFRLDNKGEISPVASADKVDLDSFIGYDDERSLVVENTRSFVMGKPSANVLLYGDAGTGKSSTVKATVNHFYDKGLRLIELRKDQLYFLPDIMARIVENPLKFIIFIDDLSFNKNDDNFSMLKAALEGSASVKAANALIYATSNRRHIVKETFDDREGGDVHRNDTMQEKLSLSERFGLSVLFQKPPKQLYLKIVHVLAEKYAVDMDISQLDIRAEEFALRKGNRSPRCAEQFIKSLL